MTNQQLPHVWYYQEKESGKGSHMFFEGKTIYSYGRHFPIACLHNDVVLFTTDTYSMTTQRHISLVRRAIPSFAQIIYCKHPDEASNGYHTKNIESYKRQLESIKRDLGKARKKQPHLQNLASTYNKLAAYSTYFQLDISEFNEIQTLINSPEAVQLLTQKEKELSRAVKLKQDQQLQDWLKGEINTAPQLPFDSLRIKDGQIETTKGLVFDLQECELFHRFIDKATEFKHYRIVRKDDILYIGCHKFKTAYLKQFGNKLFKPELI